ncbi:DUF4172 domain-containing protein [Botryobacter ruber]|uniref:DUF4172 domain-containing protein n=1 Tax=Botryobacter ruber TaxID=2171629 RepID=UPI00196A5486|nr:DUF4172 domain-containing protein [Botryobacter ruber]
MEGLGFSVRSETMLQTLTQDVLKSTEIEGEILDPEQVRSSIAKRLGMDIAGLIPTDRKCRGSCEDDYTREKINLVTNSLQIYRFNMLWLILQNISRLTIELSADCLQR